MHKESAMQLHGGHVVIGGSRGMGLATARLARHEGAAVTTAGRSQEKLIQAERELGGGHATVMDIPDEGAVGQALAGLRHVDQGLISAGTILNGTIVKNAGASALLVSQSPHPNASQGRDLPPAMTPTCSYHPRHISAMMWNTFRLHDPERRRGG
jgi:NAD(P)-dependent dehydrogenase (short-subunit alcohol dehydrogenase family)